MAMKMGTKFMVIAGLMGTAGFSTAQAQVKNNDVQTQSTVQKKETLYIRNKEDNFAQFTDGGFITHQATKEGHESYTVTKVVIDYDQNTGRTRVGLEGFSDRDQATGGYQSGSGLKTFIALQAEHDPRAPFGMDKPDVRAHSAYIEFRDPYRSNVGNFEITLEANLQNSNNPNAFEVAPNQYAGTEGYAVKKMFFHGKNVPIILNGSLAGAGTSVIEGAVESGTSGKGLSVDFITLRRNVLPENGSVQMGTFAEEIVRTPTSTLRQDQYHDQRNRTRSNPRPR